MPKRKAKSTAAASALAPKRTLRDFSARVSKTVGAAAPSKKRKLADVTNAPKEEDVRGQAVVVQDGDEDVVVKPIQTKPVSTPKPKSSAAATSSGTGSARKRTRLDDFAVDKRAKTQLDAFVTRTPRKPAEEKKAEREGSPLLTGAASEKHEKFELPENLQVLVSIHASLLTAMLLHKGQNQVSGILPAFTTIRPHIERLTKRALTLEDLRRIVWISHYDATAAAPPDPNEQPGELLGQDAAEGVKSGLKLVDYGRGKICVAFEETDTRRLVQVESLRDDFAVRMRAWWTQTQEAEAPAQTKDSITEHPTPTPKSTPTKSAPSKPAARSLIPLAPLHAHTHKSTIAHVLHSKSAALLSDLKHSTISKPSASPAPSGSAASRSSALLSRIRAKAAAAVPAPSAETLARRAAEQRVPEVREVLRGYRAKGSNLGLRAVVEGVRESARNPIGVKEAELAIRICAQSEEWVDVVESGGVEAVVFRKLAGVGGGGVAFA